jgi:hypothetical protein
MVGSFVALRDVDSPPASPAPPEDAEPHAARRLSTRTATVGLPSHTIALLFRAHGCVMDM